jgi:acyl carrier protein
MNAGLLEQVQTLAADVFRVPKASLTAAASPNEIEAWDSIQNVNLVMSLEQQFSVQFDTDELERMKSIGDITEVLTRKLGPAA